MTYLLDSNTFMAAKKSYYSFAEFPGFWDWLEAKGREGVLASIAEIRDEIEGGDEDDDLVVWTRAGKAPDFFDPDDDVLGAMTAVTDWVMAQDFKESDRSRFFAKADPLLIAHAMSKEWTVVTQESFAGPGTKKVKIPNVCAAMDVQCIDTFQLLATLRAKFVMAP